MVVFYKRWIFSKGGFLLFLEGGFLLKVGFCCIQKVGFFLKVGFCYIQRVGFFRRWIFASFIMWVFSKGGFLRFLIKDYLISK